MNNPASNFGATPAGGVYEGEPHCVGGDPTCPCQDGLLCHYVDDPVTETAAISVIPAEVEAICDFNGPAPVVKLVSPSSCYLTVGPLELRFRRVATRGWEWDEIVGECFVHVEMMDLNDYWIGFSGDWGRVCVHIRSKRAPVTMRGWTE